MTTNSKVQSPKSKVTERRRRLAFTLIELLVVIAIIGILAAMIIPVAGIVKRMKLRMRTEKELRVIENAIMRYKTTHGFYPPDNPGAPDGINQLYYELSGTTNDGGVNVKNFTTLDRNATISSTVISAVFTGKNGFMNSMQGKAGDEGIIAQNFLKGGIHPEQIATVTSTRGGQQVNILIGSVRWPHGQLGDLLNQPGGNQDSYNPVLYVSSNPTNKPNEFDLWIDIIVDGKTNRFCNWSEKYVIVP